MCGYGYLSHTVIEVCTTLSVINFSKSPHLKPESLITLFEINRYLTCVNVSSCPLVTDECVVTLANNCPSLSVIRLDHCVKITGVSVVAIADKCKQLTTLSLNSCFRVTASSVLLLVQRSRQLIELNPMRRSSADRQDHGRHRDSLQETQDSGHQSLLQPHGPRRRCNLSGLQRAIQFADEQAV